MSRLKITIEPTQRFVEIGANGHGVPARIWEGTTEDGTPVYLAVTRLAVRGDYDQEKFERELVAAKPPSPEAIRAIPLKLIV